MNFSSKIKKFYEGMRVYDCLLEDEKAIHLPFALSFTVTITTILDQLTMGYDGVQMVTKQDGRIRRELRCGRS